MQKKKSPWPAVELPHFSARDSLASHRLQASSLDLGWRNDLIKAYGYLRWCNSGENEELWISSHLLKKVCLWHVCPRSIFVCFHRYPESHQKTIQWYATQVGQLKKGDKSPGTVHPLSNMMQIHICLKHIGMIYIYIYMFIYQYIYIVYVYKSKIYIYNISI